MEISANVAFTIASFLNDLPARTDSQIKRIMASFGRGVRTKLIRTRMRGRPGILWTGKKDVGGNIKTWIKGSGATTTAHVRISRFLRYHEEGRTVVPKNGEWLYIVRDRKVYARVRQVIIPARLGFRKLFDDESQKLQGRMANGMARAVVQARQRAVRRILRIAA